jgi:hypothetical protein
MEPTLVFRPDPGEQPGIELCVNFGVFAGREATAAEIDRLAGWLLDEVGEVSIIAEDRHEIDTRGEAAVHQVRVEVAAGRVPEGPFARRVLERRIRERVEHWARLCVAERPPLIA